VLLGSARGFGDRRRTESFLYWGERECGDWFPPLMFYLPGGSTGGAQEVAEEREGKGGVWKARQDKASARRKKATETIVETTSFKTFSYLVRRFFPPLPSLTFVEALIVHIEPGWIDFCRAAPFGEKEKEKLKKNRIQEKQGQNPCAFGRGLDLRDQTRGSAAPCRFRRCAGSDCRLFLGIPGPLARESALMVAQGSFSPPWARSASAPT